MNNLRTAAQQALEAMEMHVPQYLKDRGYPPITALRAALAEPVLNPAPGYCKHCKQYTIEEPLPAEPVQELKPVAWMFEFPDKRIAPKFDSCPHGGNWVPLYTSSPQRKPLTEEEIDSIWDSEKAFADIYAIARAIERAHGIV